MTGTRLPDPAIADWLADGPTELPSQARRAIGAAVRTTHQLGAGVSWLPDLHGVRLLAVAGVVIGVLLTLGLAAGAARLVPPTVVPAPTLPPAPTVLPAPTWPAREAPACWPADSTVPIASQGTLTLPGTTVTLDYAIPADLDLDAEAANGAVGFGTPVGLPQTVPGGRGVVVVDVSEAVRHGSLVEQPRLGTDAESFLRDLDMAFPYQDEIIDFKVDDVAPTQVAGMPAWSATVSVPRDVSMWSHIDTLGGSDRGCAAEFGMANRVWVLDVGPSIVLVQAWASDEAELAAWLPDAVRLIDTFRFRRGAM